MFPTREHQSHHWMLWHLYDNIRVLNVSTWMTDDNIKKCPKLEIIDFQHNTKITDDGIANMRNIRELHVGYNNNITNVGLWR